MSTSPAPSEKVINYKAENMNQIIYSGFFKEGLDHPN